MKQTDNTPRIYVGTYAKYNNGSLAGAWLDLDDYADHDEWVEAIAELHKDESDPEYMFQDHEGIPDQYISESGLISEYWDYKELLDNTHLDKEAVDAGLSLGIPLDNIEDAYYGHYESDTELGREYIDSTGMLDAVPESLTYYFDYEAFGRDYAQNFSEEAGHYFTDNR